MAKFPINKNQFEQQRFNLDVQKISKLNRPTQNSPYSYGNGTIKFGQTGKYNRTEYLPNSTGTESVFSVTEKTEPRFWLYGTTAGTLNCVENCFLNLQNGESNLYVVDTLNLLESCRVHDDMYTKLISKRILITAENGQDYTWINNNVIVNHQYDGIVDYVLRYKNLQQVVVKSEIINQNILKLYLSESNIVLGPNEYYELIVYRISELLDDINMFEYQQNNKLSFLWNNDICTIPNKLKTVNTVSILRTSDNKSVFPNDIVKTYDTISFSIPTEYKNNLTHICTYTPLSNSRSFEIKKDTTDSIVWTVVDGKESAIFTHGLNSTVNFILSDNISVQSFIINNNKIQLIFNNVQDLTNPMSVFFYSILVD